MTTLFQFKDLSLSIHEKTILTGVNLTLSPGEITGLVGRSGSGKSLTALAAMRLPPRGSKLSGSVELSGENLLDKSEDEMCSIRGNDIAMVFQEPMTALNPLHTIAAQVAETILIHSTLGAEDAHQQAIQLLARVGLMPDHIPPTRFPHELSGGQRQRVMIAMAIAMKPKLLIADEPTTALDVTTQAEILGLLRKLTNEDQMALLLITHDLGVIANMADKIAVMQAGCIREENTVDQFFHADRSPAIQELLTTPIKRKINTTPNEQDNIILEAEKMVCHYPLPRKSLFSAPTYFRAVDDVSFNICKGENIGLVGGSGCGKSTLARGLLGLLPLAQGTLKIHGEGFPNKNKKSMRRLRRKIQMVFQDPYSSFNPRQKIEKYIAEPLSLLDQPVTAGDQQAQIAKALTDVDLSPSDAHKYPHAFSGGQRQRIAIARALITQPDIIIFDEATSALDVSSRNHVLELLMRLSATKQMGYLFITHDLSVVRDITDRLLVMQDGQIVESGATDELFMKPQHPYTKSLIAAMPPTL